MLAPWHSDETSRRRHTRRAVHTCVNVTSATPVHNAPNHKRIRNGRCYHIVLRRCQHDQPGSAAVCPCSQPSGGALHTKCFAQRRRHQQLLLQTAAIRGAQTPNPALFGCIPCGPPVSPPASSENGRAPSRPGCYLVVRCAAAGLVLRGRGGLGVGGSRAPPPPPPSGGADFFWRRQRNFLIGRRPGEKFAAIFWGGGGGG